MKKRTKLLFSVLVMAFSILAAAGQQTSPEKQQSEKTLNSEAPDITALKIIKKPAALIYTACGNSSGTVIFDVTFDKTGKVADVKTLQNSSCSYFDTQAEKAAFTIEFKPATENAQPITVVKTVAYSWGLVDYCWSSLNYAGNF